MDRTKLYRLIQYCSSNRMLLILGSVFLVMNVFILPYLLELIKAESQGTGILDLKPFYSAEEARQHIAIYGAEGRRIYLRAEWTGDFIYPAIYGLFLSGASYRLGAANWSVLPLGSMLSDYCENIGISTMLVSYPSFSVIIANMTALFTALKWTFFMSTILLLLLRLSIMIADRQRKKRTLNM